MVKMKITKVSHLGASESIKLQTTYHHSGHEDGEEEEYQKNGAENFFTWLYWRSLAHAKTFQNNVLCRPYNGFDFIVFIFHLPAPLLQICAR